MQLGATALLPQQAAASQHQPGLDAKKRKMLLEDAIVNTSIKFKGKPTNKEPSQRSKRSVPPEPPAGGGVANPLMMDKSDVRAFARYGLPEQDAGSQMAQNEARSKSKNAVIYEHSRYLDDRKDVGLENGRKSNGRIREEDERARDAQDNYEFYRERAAKS